MYLVQIFLPLRDNDENRFSPELYAHLREELITRFKGLTAYTRSPAVGLWKPAKDEAPAKDEIVIYEVMDPHLDVAWWNELRRKLEVLFRQQSILVRATEIRVL